LNGDETAGRGKVWITGAGGLIGSYIVRLAGKYAPDFQIIPLTRAIWI
jgi:nucleoside-diphosphate-sugar epimerase